ncbi:RNA-directed DNA polymerase from mobile element jockey-like [Elysia marginata]|uniref:RNA-directed DNA polymerase from mobile element jockey-like n=1 Tax=Elysia marginata TaxID=1093978 RepID=A0AAV4IT23_9GAST|nr:RNA-directed DNA polymerase from mobile element jockey-like [Elysia marginata]
MAIKESPSFFLSSPITRKELEEVIKCMKSGKAAGIDGIYPDMVTHLGQHAMDWLAAVMTNILDKGTYPQIWKHARVVAIFKPGKPANESSSYRPIPLLSCIYKLLERIILARITPYVEPNIPVQKAGFKHQRGTTKQVLAFSSHIEAGFENKLKTGAVLIDLSAAYDIVWT